MTTGNSNELLGASVKSTQRGVATIIANSTTSITVSAVDPLKAFTGNNSTISQGSYSGVISVYLHDATTVKIRAQGDVGGDIYWHLVDPY